MLQGCGALIGSFLLAAKHQDDAAFRIEFDDHVRALVDLHGVGEGPGVKIVANLAEKLAVRGEFQELRGARGVGRASGIAASEDEDVSLGIDSHAGNFTEIDVGRKLQDVGDGMIPNLGRLLGGDRDGEQEKQNENGTIHGSLQFVLAYTDSPQRFWCQAESPQNTSSPWKRGETHRIGY